MDSGKETILVVDDEEALRTLLAVILGKEGYRVLKASSGEQALNVYEAHKAEIRMIITDIRMPKMTGPELVNELAARGCKLPVLYITAFSEQMRAEKLPGESRELLAKPFSPDALVTRVRRLLGVPPKKPATSEGTQKQIRLKYPKQ